MYQPPRAVSPGVARPANNDAPPWWQAQAAIARLRGVKIGPDDIRKVAHLARLDLTSEEEASMVATLDAILTYMETLNTLDTTNVEPTAHIIDLDTPWRADEVTNDANTEALLANAPARDGNHFRVPKIID